MQPNILFIQIYKGKSHISMPHLLITMLISIVPCLFTEIQFTCSYSQFLVWRHLHDNKFYCPSVPLRNQYSGQPHPSISDGRWRIKVHEITDSNPYFLPGWLQNLEHPLLSHPVHFGWLRQQGWEYRSALALEKYHSRVPLEELFSNKKRNQRNRAWSSSWNVFKTG